MGNWSDGRTVNPHTDANVTNSLRVTANFWAGNFSPPVILPGPNVSGGNFNFQFSGTLGQHYHVEFSPALPASGPWPVLTDIVSLAASPFTLVDPISNVCRL